MILYHHSHRQNRQSILANGLLVRHGERAGGHAAIFLTDRSRPSPTSDAWTVDVDGLPVEEDDGEPENEGESWFAVYEDVPASRLKLLQPLLHVQPYV